FGAESAAGTNYGPDANQLACEWLSERIAEAESQINYPRLNEFFLRAADEGCIAIAVALMDRGASVLARDRFSNTALIKAARSGHANMVRLLVDRGSEIDHANLNGSTALATALARKRDPVVELLMSRGAKTARVDPHGITLLCTAAFNGEEAQVRRLLGEGADPAEADGTGKGPIVYAAGKGFAPIVKLLLDAGLDANATYAHNLTALMWAAGHANIVTTEAGLATVALLVERGAEIDRVDDRGRSALMIAAERGHAEIAAWLIGHGADPALADKGGKTASDLAATPAVRQALKAATRG
ncbi:MAG: ankyrin repeat domain-containing protein, partial [Propylenella sp.]